MAKKQTQQKSRNTRKSRRNPIDQGKTMSRSLTHTYILALSVIAVLTIAGHMMIDHISTGLIRSAELTYVIGRQRALVQQTMIYAEKHYQTRDQLDHDFLSKSVKDMEEGHALLMAKAQEKDESGRLRSNVLYDAYYSGKEYGAQHNTGYVQLAKRYVTLPALEDKEEERKKLKEDLTGPQPKSLITTFDIILEDFQAESLKQISQAYTLQSWAAGLVILILLFEAIFIFRPMVNRIREYHSMLLKEALEDYLTGLYNRRAFIKRANVELALARREKTPTTVVLTDLDRFKSVNDTYGHKVGDLVLKHFSDLARESFRTADVIGRVGGEEFAFLLPRTESERGFHIVERFRKHVCDNPCYYRDENGEEKALSFSASFGMVVAYDNIWSIEELMAAADERLYAAKGAGRNCVVTGELTAKKTAPQKDKPDSSDA